MNTSIQSIRNELSPYGFSVSPFATNPRLQVIKLTSDTVKLFIEQALPLGVQAIEYKPF
jgi:protein CsiD